MPVEQVHLHEVGALDSIIDIVGVVFALEWFGADRVVCSPLNVGGGMVQSAHGLFPVPAPATVRLLGDAPIYGGAVQKELVTPTGALIVTVVRDGVRPDAGDVASSASATAPATATIRRTPNVLRVLIGAGGGRGRRRARHRHRVRDRRHEPADLRRRHGPAVRGRRARGVLRAGADEEEPARHAADGGRAAGAARGAGRHHLPRDDDDRAAPRTRSSASACEREIVTVETPVGAVRVQGGAGATGASSTPCPSSKTARQLAAAASLPVKEVQALAVQAYRPQQGPTVVTRFFLTTAIDYVNSRPHLGTAYEKVAADVIARYKRLCGVRHAVPDGQRRALAERVQEGDRAGARSAGVLRSDGAGVPRTWRAASTSRSTTSSARPSRATRRASRSSSRRIHDAGDIYEGVYEGWYCVGCEAFKQEKDLVDGKCPLHLTTTPQWIREKNYFFRLSKYQQPLLDHFAAHPDFLQPDDAPQRDPAAARGRPRGHLGQPRRAVVGHSAAVRPVERRVRLVRRAHQLRVGGRPGRRRRDCSSAGGRPICTSSARTSRGFTRSSGRRC